jgi:hypothetical protein
MRLSALVVLIALPGAVIAQHAQVINPSRGMQAPAGAWRYGNILFPGGVPAHQNSHAARLGATISGNPPFTGVAPGFPRPGFPGGGRARTVVVPYAYPVFVGGGGYYDGYGAGAPSTNVTVVVPQQPAPQVIINNSYVPETANPVVREYSQGEPTESSGIRVYEGAKVRTATPPAAPKNGTSIMDEKATIYLIALTDGTVRQAIGYWQQGDTFHYITPDSTINHLSLAMVDRERSIQLNAERKLEFDIRPPR